MCGGYEGNRVVVLLRGLPFVRSQTVGDDGLLISSPPPLFLFCPEWPFVKTLLPAIGWGNDKSEDATDGVYAAADDHDSHLDTSD